MPTSPQVSRGGPLGGKVNSNHVDCQGNTGRDPLAGRWQWSNTSAWQNTSDVNVFSLLFLQRIFFKEGKWNYNVELTGKPLCTPPHALHFSSSTCNPLGNGSISQGDDISLGRSAIWGETEGMHYTASVGTQPSKLLAPGTEQKATSVCFTGGSRQTQNQTQPCN